MEKKKSIGIIVIGVIFILINFIAIVGHSVDYNGNWPRILAYLLWLISGIGLLFFHNWARILSLFPMGYLFIIHIIFHRELINLPFIIILPLFMFYLTRSKVKEQFK